MKSKKPRPTFNRYSQPKRQPTRILWMIIALLVAVTIIIYMVWSYTSNDAADNGTTIVISTVDDKIGTAQLPSVPKASTDLDNRDITLNDTITVNDDNISAKTIVIPDPKTIVEAPLPKTNSLAKEEIDRLSDEKLRFAEQQRLAAEQVVISEQLTQMKAEQIALLEQQIAQLEAQKRAEALVE